MPPINDRYQRYAASLGEPVTDDLKAFVDGLDVPYTAAPLPDSLARFRPSEHLAHQEVFTMRIIPDVPAVTPHTSPATLDRQPRSRVSLGLVAALLLIMLVAGGIAAKQVWQSRPGQAPQATIPAVASATSTQSTTAKIYVTCLGVSAQEPAPEVTTCDTVPHGVNITLNSMVYLTYCYASDIPEPSAILAEVYAPDGHHSLAWGPVEVGQRFCGQSGSYVDIPGQYLVKVYWNPNTNVMKGPRQPPDPVTDHTWQLQLTAQFTVK